MATTADIINHAYQTARSRPQQAVEDLQRSLRLHVDDPDLHTHLGMLLMQLGQSDQSLYHLHRATTVAPTRADLHSNYATALNMQGKTAEAAEAYRRGTAADPRSYAAHLGLSSALFGRGDFNAAIDAARRAVELNPRAPEPAINLGLALTRAGRADEGITAFREGLARTGENIMLLMNLAMALNYRPEPSAQDIFDAHARLGRVVTSFSGTPQPLFPDTNPDRPLRIGYLCPDFPDRAVANFIKPILSAHDRAQFDVVCYSGRPPGEPDNAGLSSLAAWVPTAGMYDPALEQRIRSDKIDILVYLCSLGPMSRLFLLPRRAAPIQISYLGSPTTAGFKAAAYRFTDNTLDGPEGGAADALHTEKLIRLEGSSFCYTPPADAPDVAPRSGPITLGCLGNPQKINDPLLDCWAAILKAIPDSRLLLKYATLDAPATREHYTSALASRGISADRITLQGHTPDYRDHLATYNQIDIALDTFPYNGMATTCEALWMGVPVVTLAGDRHAGRMGQSILDAAGLGGGAPASVGEYIDFATLLAKDSARRAELRRTLRDKLKSSPVCTSGPALTRQLEAHYRAMWKTFIGGVFYSGAPEAVSFVKE